MFKFKADFKKEWTKDWRFWYKSFFAIFTFIILTWSFIYNTNAIDSNYNGSFLFYFLETTIYFTFQTNCFVMIWFFYAAIHHNKEGKIGILKNNWTWAITVLITCTMLIPHLWFLPTGIISNALAHNDIPVDGWKIVRSANNQTANSKLPLAVNLLTQEYYHLVLPLSLIIYVCIWFKVDKNNLVEMKQVFKKLIPLVSLYPAFYSIAVLLIGEVAYVGGLDYSHHYPYFFYFIHENGHNPKYTWMFEHPDGTTSPGGYSWPLPGIHISGAVWALLTIFVFAAIIIGSGTLYYKIFIRRAQKNKNVVE